MSGAGGLLSGLGRATVADGAPLRQLFRERADTAAGAVRGPFY